MSENQNNEQNIIENKKRKGKYITKNQKKLLEGYFTRKGLIRWIFRKLSPTKGYLEEIDNRPQTYYESMKNSNQILPSSIFYVFSPLITLLIAYYGLTSNISPLISFFLVLITLFITLLFILALIKGIDEIKLINEFILIFLSEDTKRIDELTEYLEDYPKKIILDLE